MAGFTEAVSHIPARDNLVRADIPSQAGFVQSTVLKTITEHPQGMTIAEIVTELAPQDIGQRSIADALGVLVQEQKVNLQGSRGKYIPAAAEVPTAPDQPSW